MAATIAWIIARLRARPGKGPTFVVWLGDGNEGRHQIDHNYFGPREKLGKNGGETIRVGDSKTAMLTGGCVVEKNLFEKCNGETECISNKSCGNIYRDNTFLEVSGTLTLRHGNGCIDRAQCISRQRCSANGRHPHHRRGPHRPRQLSRKAYWR